MHFVLDQDRLHLMGLTPSEAGEQIQFLLTGVPVTQVREDIRAVDIVARTSGSSRLDPNELMNMTLTSRDGHAVPIATYRHGEHVIWGATHRITSTLLDLLQAVRAGTAR